MIDTAITQYAVAEDDHITEKNHTFQLARKPISVIVYQKSPKPASIHAARRD